MIWNGVSNEERLRLWKKLREEIKDKNIEEQLSEIAKFYSAAPFGARTIDYYSPQNWPTPWEIFYYGSFCTSSISLLIFYTVTMVAPTHNVDLYLIEDDLGIYLIPIVDNHFVLNYQLGQVNTFPDIKNDFTIKQVFPQGQIKTIT